MEKSHSSHSSKDLERFEPRGPATFQDRMLQDDNSFKKKRDQSRTEILSNLPELPHEIEIKGELKDEEELLSLYKEIEAKKQVAANKRREIATKKVEKLEEEKQERLHRLKELEEKKPVDWNKEKFDFIQEKRRIEEKKKKEQELGLEMLRLQKEQTLERLFEQKKELERINKQKESIRDKKKVVNIQYDALDEEIKLQDKSSKEFLDRVLQRGTYIEQKLLSNDALKDEEAADLLKALVDKRLGEEFSKQNLMDKLYEAKVREIKKNETLARDRIKDLNTRKKELTDLENKVLEEKGKHQVLVQRGLDFWVEMVLGNGPDIDDIKMNIQVQPRDHRTFRTRNQILSSAETTATKGEEKIVKLREELQWDKRHLQINDRLRLELEQFFQTCDKETYTIAKDLVYLMVDEAVFQINKKDEKLQEMLKQRDGLENRKEKLTKEMKELKHRSAVVQIRDDILDRIITELAFETAKENMYLSKKIDEKMLEILARALKLERGSTTSQADLQVLAQNLEDDKLVAAREALMNLFEERPNERPKQDTNKTFEQRWWEINPDLEDRYNDEGGGKGLNEECRLI